MDTWKISQKHILVGVQVTSGCMLVFEKIMQSEKWGSKPNIKWHWQNKPKGDYTVSAGYLWALNRQGRVKWARSVLTKACIPRQAIIWWLVMKGKLPLKARLSRSMQIDPWCVFCEYEIEDHVHVFITCSFTQRI